MKTPIINIVVFDTETTGLSKDKNAIIEIYCCGFDNELNDIKEFHSGVMKIYGNREIVEQALQANGITRDQIATGNDPQEQIEKLCAYFKSLAVGRNKPVVAGRNIDKFDLPFMNDMFAYFKKNLADYINDEFTIDTMHWARLKRVEQTNYKLGTCCEEEGIELINAHRAQADTIANKQLVKKYIQNLRSDSEMKKEKRFRATFEF